MRKSFGEQVDGALRVAGRLVALAALTGLVFFILGMALKPLFPGGLPPGPEGAQLYLSLVIFALGVAQVAMVALAEKGDWDLTGLGPRGWSPLAILAGLGIGVGIPGIAALVDLFFASPPAALTWVWPTTTIFMTLVLGSLVEALALRGYTIGLIESESGTIIAVALTALLATLFELREEAPTLITLLDAVMMAICLGVLRLRMGSLAASWLAQFTAGLCVLGIGAPRVPGVTAGLFAVVTFLLYRIRPQTDQLSPQR